MGLTQLGFSVQLTLFIKHFLSNDNFQRENEISEDEAGFLDKSPGSSATAYHVVTYK